MSEQQSGEVLGYSVGAALAAIAKDFTQIPLDPNAPLIPYGDLQAQGAYGRGLILPDDIYPVLNHMALTGSKNGAKLATGANVDGAQDVYVVNQSGGGSGGAGSPTQYGGVAFDTTLIDQQTFFEDIGTLNVPAKYIYEWHWSAAITRAITSSDKTAEIEAFLQAPGGTTFVRIFHAVFSTLGNNFVQNGGVSLVNPIDIAATFGGATPHVFMDGGSAFFSANVSINGI